MEKAVVLENEHETQMPTQARIMQAGKAGQMGWIGAGMKPSGIGPFFGRTAGQLRRVGVHSVRQTEIDFKVRGYRNDQTITDYFRISDERRAELIDGRFYEVKAPETIHQVIAMELAYSFRSYLKSHGAEGVVLATPISLQLDLDQSTMLQPDVIVLHDKSRLVRRCVYGAPDLVVEVLSTGSEAKDLFLKAYKYASADVQEYWVVDTERQKVLVYIFQSSYYPIVYDFESKIPVEIWNNCYEVDFARIYDDIRQIPDEET